MSGGDTASVSCDAVASSPVHISCSVSSISIELASAIGNSNRVRTAFAGKPALSRLRSVLRSVLTRFFVLYGFALSRIFDQQADLSNDWISMRARFANDGIAMGKYLCSHFYLLSGFLRASN